jgi:hypothetical protein
MQLHLFFFLRRAANLQQIYALVNILKPISFPMCYYYYYFFFLARIDIGLTPEKISLFPQ